jgi:hypothetical protein
MTLVIATVAGTPVVAQLSAGSISRGQFHSGLAKDAHATDARLHRAAAELYQATSRDAETFEAALLIPEIRLRLEQALHQKLSDQMLRRLASQAKAEARYWYSYMQGLERVGDVSPAAR